MSETSSPTIGPSRARGEENARKWRKRRSRLRRRLRRTGDVALVALALFAVVYGLHKAHSGGGSAAKVTAAPGSLDALHPPMKDVQLVGCGYWKPNLHAGVVTVGIINHTNTPWTYYVDVRWKDGTKRFAETVLHSKPVVPFHGLRVGGFGWAPNHAPPKHLTCSIVTVRRVGV